MVVTLNKIFVGKNKEKFFFEKPLTHTHVQTKNGIYPIMKTYNSNYCCNKKLALKIMQENEEYFI